jgi:hypothetical protein
MATRKGTIAILTGGGDVPGLNPTIRAITTRALREGYRVVGDSARSTGLRWRASERAGSGDPRQRGGAGDQFALRARNAIGPQMAADGRNNRNGNCIGQKRLTRTGWI